MARRSDNAAKEVQRQEVDEEEKVLLTQIKMESTLQKVDEKARRHTEEVDSRIKLIRDTTDKEVLQQLKLPDFLALKIDKGSALSLVATRSRSRKPGKKIGDKQPTWTRVQSLDRERTNEPSTLSLLRWRYACAPGGPLEESWANVQNPTTSKGVISSKSHKMMNQVNRDVLMTFDQNTSDQVKTMTANLGKIVNMVT